MAPWYHIAEYFSIIPRLAFRAYLSCGQAFFLLPVWIFLIVAQAFPS